MATPPLWRSLLYVPANVRRFVDGAARSGADAIQLDLEDSVAPSEKDAARRATPGAAERLAGGRADVIVRINRPLALAVRDIEASVCPHVSALSLPKIEGPDHVRLLSEAVTEAELRQGMEPGHTRFIVAIETPSAWLRMSKIARADARIVAMLLGAEDFATSVGMGLSPEAMWGPKQALVIACAAAGVLPLGLVGSLANYRDLDALQDVVGRSRELGFKGSGCIHPAQVPVLNEGFSPPDAEIDRARMIIESFETGLSVSRGAVGFEGAMVDLPVVERARQLLALAARAEQADNADSALR